MSPARLVGLSQWWTFGTSHLTATSITNAQQRAFQICLSVDKLPHPNSTNSTVTFHRLGSRIALPEDWTVPPSEIPMCNSYQISIHHEPSAILIRITKHPIYHERSCQINRHLPRHLPYQPTTGAQRTTGQREGAAVEEGEK